MQHSALRQQKLMVCHARRWRPWRICWQLLVQVLALLSCWMKTACRCRSQTANAACPEAVLLLAVAVLLAAAWPQRLWGCSCHVAE
jgi:hypothetical protein